MEDEKGFCVSGLDNEHNVIELDLDLATPALSVQQAGKSNQR